MSEPQIYIRGFPKSTNEKDLERHFEKIGTIKEVRIINAYAFIVSQLIFRGLKMVTMLKKLLNSFMDRILMVINSEWKLLEKRRGIGVLNPAISADIVEGLGTGETAALREEGIEETEGRLFL